MSNLSNDQVKISQRKSIETHMKELSEQESGLRVLRQNKATNQRREQCADQQIAADGEI